jgi:predicted Rossmann fold nucleotide-binding protein DprA/Smf involved in DNA uptake
MTKTLSRKADVKPADAEVDANTTTDVAPSKRQATPQGVAVTMGMAPKPGSKRSALLDLLGRDEGAHIDELISATGWQGHTIRAALSGLRKQGHVIVATKGEGGTSYRLQASTQEA